MNKTDNRHYNNRSKNIELHKELDLWVMFVKNNKKPLLLGKAIVKKEKGWIEDLFFELYYSPSDLFKDSPYLLIGINNDWNCRYDTIKQSKYYLKKQYFSIKWIK